MNASYSDIVDRLGEPHWWDEHAVPRYCDFSPDAVADIYADEAALVLIACQNCGHRFEVAFSAGAVQRVLSPGQQTPLAKSIEQLEVAFGDPPNIRCCPAGPTMTSDALQVLEYWERRRVGAWSRDSRREVGLG